MNPLDRFQPNAQRVAAKVMDGEAVIIDLVTGTYYSLTEAGGRIWELLEAGASAPVIVETIAREYGVDRPRVTADVDALVTTLLAEQLITTVHEANGHVPATDAPALAGAAVVYRTPELQIYRDMQDLLALDPPMPGLQDIPWK